MCGPIFPSDRSSRPILRGRLGLFCVPPTRHSNFSIVCPTLLAIPGTASTKRIWPVGIVAVARLVLFCWNLVYFFYIYYNYIRNKFFTLNFARQGVSNSCLKFYYKYNSCLKYLVRSPGPWWNNNQDAAVYRLYHTCIKFQWQFQWNVYLFRNFYGRWYTDFFGVVCYVWQNCF